MLENKIEICGLLECSDVIRDILYYEVSDEKGNILIEFLPNKKGKYDIQFNDTLDRKIMTTDLLKNIIQKVENRLYQPKDRGVGLTAGKQLTAKEINKIAAEKLKVMMRSGISSDDWHKDFGEIKTFWNADGEGARFCLADDAFIGFVMRVV